MTTARERAPWWAWPLLVVLLPVLAVGLLVGLVVWLAAALVLLASVWAAWCPRGRYALVVYSHSPIWQEYFERHVLPAVGDRAVVLNWSERKRWRYSLATTLFRFFAGAREFNPLAVVFRPFAWPRLFRFYRPFQALKHGETTGVEEMQRDFLKVLDQLAPTSDGD